MLKGDQICERARQKTSENNENTMGREKRNLQNTSIGGKSLKTSRQAPRSSHRVMMMTYPLMTTSAQVVKTSANVITNIPSQDYTHPGHHALLICDMTPEFKSFAVQKRIVEDPRR